MNDIWKYKWTIISQRRRIKDNFTLTISVFRLFFLRIPFLDLKEGEKKRENKGYANYDLRNNTELGPNFTVLSNLSQKTLFDAFDS